MSYWKGRQYIGVGPGDLYLDWEMVSLLCSWRGFNVFIWDRSSRAVRSSG